MHPPGRHRLHPAGQHYEPPQRMDPPLWQRLPSIQRPRLYGQHRILRHPMRPFGRHVLHGRIAVVPQRICWPMAQFLPEEQSSQRPSCGGQHDQPQRHLHLHAPRHHRTHLSPNPHKPRPLGLWRKLPRFPLPLPHIVQRRLRLHQFPLNNELSHAKRHLLPPGGHHRLDSLGHI